MPPTVTPGPVVYPPPLPDWAYEATAVSAIVMLALGALITVTLIWGHVRSARRRRK